MEPRGVDGYVGGCGQGSDDDAGQPRLPPRGQFDDAERDARVAEDLLAVASVRRGAVGRAHDPPDDLDDIALAIAVAVVLVPVDVPEAEAPAAVLDLLARVVANLDPEQSLAQRVEHERDRRRGRCQGQVDRRRRGRLGGTRVSLSTRRGVRRGRGGGRGDAETGIETETHVLVPGDLDGRVRLAVLLQQVQQVEQRHPLAPRHCQPARRLTGTV